MGDSLQRVILRFLAAVAALLIVYGLESVVARSAVRPDVSDFRVVFCGERAVLRERADPYRVEPLRGCEHATGLEAGEPAWSVTPFPLPSYAVTALSPLAFLPYHAARALWIVLLISSFGLAALAVATILNVPGFAVGLVFAPTLGVLNLEYGEPVLISVAALCLAALAVTRGKPRLAALAAAVAMIEPHVGLPAALGLFVFVPEARRTLGIAAVVLAAAGLLTLGPATNVEYVRDFLPAQARAELLAQDQFSLSRLLYVLGAAPKTALFLGSLSYGCTVLIGLWAARLLVARSFTVALYVLVPVATAMIGGPFIHDVQVAAALPAALVLAPRLRTARVAVALLALDWTAPVVHLVVPAFAAAAGASSAVFPKATEVRRSGYTLGAACAVLALALVLHRSPSSPLETARRSPPAFAANELSSVPWGWRIELTPSWSQSGVATALMKLPVWAGLLLLPLSLATRTVRRSRRILLLPEGIRASD